MVNKNKIFQVYVNGDQEKMISEESKRLGLSVSSLFKMLFFSQVKNKGDSSE
ncbi:MAG: hypothetical protein NUV46_00620 [Nanoarchaeota archaeon]|nr:hypothetical protein [Nanoarchaeota archaeon]